MIFVDTNYFIRFILKDEDSQYQIARTLFSSGAKEKTLLFTSTVVIFEIYWVLGHFYELPKRELVEVLAKIVAMPFLHLEERDYLSESIKIYSDTGLDLEDSYNLVYAKDHEAKKIATFDKKLQKHF